MPNQPSSDFLQIVVALVGYLQLILTFGLAELLPVLKIVFFDLGFLMSLIKASYSLFNGSMVPVEATLNLVLLAFKNQDIRYALALAVTGNQPFFA